MNYKHGKTLKKYYCINCGKRISYQVGYYGKGRCQKCYLLSNMGKNHSNYKDGRTLKNYYCKCGKKITYQSTIYGSGLCRSCVQKERFKNKSEREKTSIATKKAMKKIDLKKIFKQNRRSGKGRKNPKLSIFLTGKKRPKHSKRMRDKGNPMFGKKRPHGKGSYYKKVWMRSSWEIAYAKYLDSKNIKWLYESKTFDLKNTTYTPDFYLPETNEYIEIKGWWRDNAKKKFKKFKRLYSNVNIKILKKKELKKLEVL